VLLDEASGEFETMAARIGRLDDLWLPSMKLRIYTTHYGEFVIETTGDMRRFLKSIQSKLPQEVTRDQMISCYALRGHGNHRVFATPQELLTGGALLAGNKLSAAHNVMRDLFVLSDGKDIFRFAGLCLPERSDFSYSMARRGYEDQVYRALKTGLLELCGKDIPQTRSFSEDLTTPLEHTVLQIWLKKCREPFRLQSNKGDPTREVIAALEHTLGIGTSTPLHRVDIWKRLLYSRDERKRDEQLHWEVSRMMPSNSIAWEETTRAMDNLLSELAFERLRFRNFANDAAAQAELPSPAFTPPHNPLSPHEEVWEVGRTKDGKTHVGYGYDVSSALGGRGVMLSFADSSTRGKGAVVAGDFGSGSGSGWLSWWIFAVVGALARRALAVAIWGLVEIGALGVVVVGGTGRRTAGHLGGGGDGRR
jgi:hypothetical protein